ncbi:cytoskeletal protein RodZ [Thermocatellispora tengchongensis]|uniref:Cytoskeletal protein RodZ n=1 Tax=Thermocatellispora tengchongensis TaxID=1073253 RepID=A0A840P199_9ACTN|nr:RodZ domain-containing protein [Thermocatellispora tengchongensis]MBB5133152.1 cytoskeletal protein RodZ [Thermocatellispora tengchongensis]
MSARGETIGSILAEARRSAGLTVGQLSARTRIREALIYGIERDDFAVCGGDFYARGHIRSIAKALGLDPDAMAQRYDESLGGEPPSVRAARVFQADNPIKLRERRSPNWSMALGVALAIVVVFGVVRVMGGDGERRASDVRPASVPAGQQADPRRTSSPAPRPGGAVAIPKRGDVVEIRMKARESSFVRVQDSKGKRLFNGTLKAGKTSTWKARKQVKVTIGNAGAVSLEVNGKDLGTLGRDGETVRRTFGPADPAR